jgi:hypothetical protein
MAEAFTGEFAVCSAAALVAAGVCANAPRFEW